MAKAPSKRINLWNAGFRHVEDVDIWSTPFYSHFDFEDAESWNDGTNEFSLSGSRSLKHSVPQKSGETSANNFTWYSERQSRRFYRYEQVWFQVHMRLPVGWQFANQQHADTSAKFMRLRTYMPAPIGSTEENAAGYNDIYLGIPSQGQRWRYIYEGGGGWVNFGDSDDDLPQDNAQWEEFQVSIVLDTVSKSAGGKGEVFFWKNDKLLYHDESRFTLADVAGYQKGIKFNDYWSNKGSPVAQTSHIDEIYYTNIKPSYTDAQGNPKLPPRNV